MAFEWVRVVEAGDCFSCYQCGDPVCPLCSVHYSECDCPGPHQDDEFEYKEIGGELYGRALR